MTAFVPARALVKLTVAEALVMNPAVTATDAADTDVVATILFALTVCAPTAPLIVADAALTDVVDTNVFADTLCAPTAPAMSAEAAVTDVVDTSVKPLISPAEPTFAPVTPVLNAPVAAVTEVVDTNVLAVTL